MWLRKRKEGKPTPVTDAVARKIAQSIVGLQVRTAIMLQRLERKCSTFQKKLLLLVFCLACGGYCLYLLAHGLLGHSIRSESPIPVEQVLPKAQPPPFPRGDSVLAIEWLFLIDNFKKETNQRR